MKILINAFPRSGSTTFTSALRLSVSKIRSGNYNEMAEFDEWIIYKHEPFIYLGNYGDDVTLAAIIRNPIDAISSNTERWLKGFTGNVIQGVRIVDKKQNRIDQIIDIGPTEKDFISHQIEIYNSYIACLEKNINNVKCFTYEQTRNETDKCIKNIMLFAGVDINKIQENYLTKTISNRETKHPIYFKVREHLEALEGLSEGYNRVLAKVLEAQKTYPIALN